MMHNQYKSGLLITGIFLACVFSLFTLSCNQDSIFSYINAEEPPLEPRVQATPTNIVLCKGSDDKGYIYVASIHSATIHRYNEGVWDQIEGPGRISGLAASKEAGGYLYALAYDDTGMDIMDALLYRYDPDNPAEGWAPVTEAPGGASLQSISGANGTIFVGGKTENGWDVFYTEQTETEPVLKTLGIDSGPLSGAAHDGPDYYIATHGGVYHTASLSTAPVLVPGSSGSGLVKGIMNVNGVITAVTENGYNGNILTGDKTGFSVISTLEEFYYTGGMSIWKLYNGVEPEHGSLLLLGVSDDRINDKGYRELSLTDGKPPLTGSHTAVVPGGELSSISPDDQSRYAASIARHSVEHILQVPISVDGLKTDEGWQPVIFAATITNGLYALRDGRWNAQN